MIKENSIIWCNPYSMGGSVAIHVAAKKLQSIFGLIVVDVVEVCFC